MKTYDYSVIVFLLGMTAAFIGGMIENAEVFLIGFALGMLGAFVTLAVLDYHDREELEELNS